MTKPVKIKTEIVSVKVLKKGDIQQRKTYERQIKIAHLEILVQEFPEQTVKFVKKHVSKDSGEKDGGLGV